MFIYACSYINLCEISTIIRLTLVLRKGANLEQQVNILVDALVRKMDKIKDLKTNDKGPNSCGVFPVCIYQK